LLSARPEPGARPGRERADREECTEVRYYGAAGECRGPAGG